MSVPSIEKLTALAPHTVVGVLAGDLLAAFGDAEDAVASANEELQVKLAAVEALLPQTAEEFPILPYQVRAALGAVSSDFVLIPRAALAGSFQRDGEAPDEIAMTEAHLAGEHDHLPPVDGCDRCQNFDDPPEVAARLEREASNETHNCVPEGCSECRPGPRRAADEEPGR